MNLTDIAYNFLVTQSGVIYEGRGWEVQSEIDGADHTLSVALIGNFENTEPTESQLEEVKLLLKECIQWKQLMPCYNILYGVPLSGHVQRWFESGKPKICNTL